MIDSQEEKVAEGSHSHEGELNRRRGQMKVAERSIRRALGLFAYSVDRSLMDSSDEVMHELKAALVYLGDENAKKASTP